MHTISIRHTLTQIIYKFIIKRELTNTHFLLLRVGNIDSQIIIKRFMRERERFVIHIVGWF